jgi:hypothetical protein
VRAGQPPELRFAQRITAGLRADVHLLTAHDRRLALSQGGVLQRFSAPLFGLGLHPLAFLVHARLCGLGLGLRAPVQGLKGHATGAGLVGVEHRPGPVGRRRAAKHGGAGLGR